MTESQSRIKQSSRHLVWNDFFDFMTVTWVIGIGLFCSVVVFLVSVGFQYRAAIDQFNGQVRDHRSATQLHLRNIHLTLEILAELIGARSLDSLSVDSKWIEKRVGQSPIECLEVQDLQSGESLSLKRTDKCEQHNVQSSIPVYLREVRPILNIEQLVSADNWLLEAVDHSRMHQIVIPVLGADRVIRAQIFLKNLLPNIGNEFVQAKIDSIGSVTQVGSASSRKALSSKVEVGIVDNMVKYETLPFLNEVVLVEYAPKSGSLTIQLGWSWGLLFFCLAVVGLTGLVMYSLVGRNIYASREVELKTIELKREAERARNASETKSRFLGNVSHEIRTPLNLINGIADLLSRTKIDEEQREYILTFKRASRHLLDLLNDILDIVRIETGQVEVVEDDIEVLELVEDILEFVAPACRKENLHLNYSVDTRLPMVIKSDGKRIRQILINLLNNAIKFTEKGEICLKAERVGSNIIFQVQDTGVGIRKEDLVKVFDEFFQVGSSTREQYRGVGLGLSIVKTCVQLLGGEVTVNSILGKGTIFTVSLPMKIKRDVSWLSKYGDCGQMVISEFADRVAIIGAGNFGFSLLKECLLWLGFRVEIYETAMEAVSSYSEGAAVFKHIVYECPSGPFDCSDLEANLALLDIDSSRVTLLLPGFTRTQELEFGLRFLGGGVCYDPIRVSQVLDGIFKNVLGIGLVDRDSAPNIGKVRPGTKIVIAEDDKDNQFLLRSFLRSLPADITFVDDGLEALEVIQKDSDGTNLLITDIQMPNMDGIELIERVRKFEIEKGRPAMQIVALTADALAGQQSRAMRAGADGYITKPIGMNDLIDAISFYASKSHPV